MHTKLRSGFLVDFAMEIFHNELLNSVSILPVKVLRSVHRASISEPLASLYSPLKRLFFLPSYLWKPWDLNEDEEDWTEEHLENRIDLFRRRNEGGDGRRNWRRIKELEGRFREEVSHYCRG